MAGVDTTLLSTPVFYWLNGIPLRPSPRLPHPPLRDYDAVGPSGKKGIANRWSLIATGASTASHAIVFANQALPAAERLTLGSLGWLDACTRAIHSG